MAGFQLDDLLKDEKKDANLIPDLSKATCTSEEEFRRLMEYCPEFKMKPDKVRREDIKVRDKDFTWKTTKRELRAIRKEWNYGNPVPPDMRELNIQELQQVSIDWRMLTSVRPKLRQDEEMFSRLVEMGKLQLKTRAAERRNADNPMIRRSKNKAGIVETSAKICGDCGEEFCSGESCGDVLYDSFIRVSVKPTEGKPRLSANAAAIIASMNAPGKSAHGPTTAGKKKQKRPGGNKGVKPAKLLVSKVKGGGKLEANKKEVKRPEEDKAGCSDGGERKFRRKCTKHQTKKRSAPTSSKVRN